MYVRKYMYKYSAVNFPKEGFSQVIIQKEF